MCKINFLLDLHSMIYMFEYNLVYKIVIHHDAPMNTDFNLRFTACTSQLEYYCNQIASLLKVKGKKQAFTSKENLGSSTYWQFTAQSGGKET